jgi:hypothetical protein
VQKGTMFTDAFDPVFFSYTGWSRYNLPEEIQ